MKYIPKLQLGNTVIQQSDATRTTPRLLYKKPIQQLNTPQDFARAASQRGTTVTNSLIDLGGKPTEKKGNYWDFWEGRLGTNLNQLGNLGMGVAKTVGASAALATGMAYTPATVGTLGALGKGLLSGAVVDQGYSLLGGRPANIGEIGLGAGATMGMPLLSKGLVNLLKKPKPKSNINLDEIITTIHNKWGNRPLINDFPNKIKLDINSGTSSNLPNLDDPEVLSKYIKDNVENFFNQRNKSGLSSHPHLRDVKVKVIGSKGRILKDIGPDPNAQKVVVPGKLNPENMTTLNESGIEFIDTDVEKMSLNDYIKTFNENIDKLNDIIKKNNTSGKPYSATRLYDDGLLQFNTGSIFGTKIVPGKFYGQVEDVANYNYFKNMPGLNMVNTNSVFGSPLRGTKTYESINEYLKLLNLGRVKPGFNSQSKYSFGLWNNAVGNNKASGYKSFDDDVIYGAMKGLIPAAGLYGLTKNKKE